ncbi:Aminopeptidase PepS [Planctomycetes bacterium Pan216]|uniref:Aminopeptidase PepS n=1 Tax=Kolteria novifilia TaxID=2527975 RepID=A0A518BA09_9BACT|nr:Aminopeptidase PepS [Planctomycetes bacterium Pan216]
MLIEAFDLPSDELVCRLVEIASERGAHPFVELRSSRVLRSLYRSAGDEMFRAVGQIEKARMEKMDAYIGVRGSDNLSELSDVPVEKLDALQKEWWKPVHLEVRVPKTKWVVLRYPNASMAQAAKKSTEAFEDFYFDVCTADYAKMARDQEPLVKRMAAAEQIRLVAPGTDLSFSTKDIPVIPCAGDRNIPDGEVFTAPVRESVNGVIRFNTPSLHQGFVFEGIELEFRDGKIVRAECNDSERLNQVFDSDEGARYCGEWSIGCNNHVRQPMLDTLFDEKIGGSIHMAMGNAYDEADNGNRSSLHWDLVLIQTPDFGGGEIWFDGELVRKDGWFLPEDLQGLNDGLP